MTSADPFTRAIAEVLTYHEFVISRQGRWGQRRDVYRCRCGRSWQSTDIRVHLEHQAEMIQRDVVGIGIG